MSTTTDRSANVIPLRSSAPPAPAPESPPGTLRIGAVGRIDRYNLARSGRKFVPGEQFITKTGEALATLEDRDDSSAV